MVLCSSYMRHAAYVAHILDSSTFFLTSQTSLTTIRTRVPLEVYPESDSRGLNAIILHHCCTSRSGRRVDRRFHRVFCVPPLLTDALFCAYRLKAAVLAYTDQAMATRSWIGFCCASHQGFVVDTRCGSIEVWAFEVPRVLC